LEPIADGQSLGKFRAATSVAGPTWYTSSRVAASLDADDRPTLDRLMRLAVHGLPLMYRPESELFAFTRAYVAQGNGWRGELRGTSVRYSAIVALGAHWLPAPLQAEVLGGQHLYQFVTRLVRDLDQVENLGDAALICWAAAQVGYSELDRALARLRQLDQPARPAYVVEAAWVVAALAAARRLADVEAPLAAARERLLGSVLPGSPVFPHATGRGLVKPYRSHVACFADQVYPIQALARLHASGDDPEALRAARACAEQICRLQGPDGQWWWHYDARTGKVIEGYPVYTVHQHAMGPMALFDLAEAEGRVGAGDYGRAIRRGLNWINGPAELGTGGEPMVHDEQGVTWRKVYRGDPRKMVRGVHTVTTRAIPGMRVPGLAALYPPDDLDRECRPYEFGWLFFAWLANLASGGGTSSSERGTWT
jgi:hypothetical protein